MLVRPFLFDQHTIGLDENISLMYNHNHNHDHDHNHNHKEYTINCDQELTIVMATIGEPELSRSIESLSQGSIIPACVLICIPFELKERVLHLADKYPFVEVVPTEVKGQVKQRIVGFQRSRTKYTIQLDSDVVVSKTLLKDLKNTIVKHQDICVGPRIIRQNTMMEYSFLSSTCNVFYKWQKLFLIWILNGPKGFQPGSMSKGGIGFGPVFDGFDPEVEWLAGCCVIHETKNLLLKDFYPKKGKAYAEDLYHSFFLRKKGITLLIAEDAYLTVMFPNAEELGFSGLIRDQLNTFLAGLGLVRLMKLSTVRYTNYFLFKSVFLIANRLIKL